MSLDALLARYRELLHLPDPTPVIAALATVAANQLPGDPVWTLLVGPPACGKTEIIDSLTAIPRTVSVSTLTKAGLLSGRGGKAGGLLITHFRTGNGLLLVKDFTTILSEAPATRTEVLAVLREVFDGHVARSLGSTDHVISWAGKLGVIAAVTEEIERHRAQIGLMGERFLHILMPPLIERGALARHALTNTGTRPELRAALADDVADYLNHLPPPTEQPLTPTELQLLSAAADLGSRARSPIIRERGEVELAPQPESPARLATQLERLWQGTRHIGATALQAGNVLRAAILGGIPQQRRRALQALLASDTPMAAGHVAVAARLPSTAAYRALEDLAYLELLTTDTPASGALWAVNDEARSLGQLLRL